MTIVTYSLTPLRLFRVPKPSRDSVIKCFLNTPVDSLVFRQLLFSPIFSCLMPARTDAPTLPWNYIAKLVCIGDSGMLLTL